MDIRTVLLTGLTAACAVSAATDQPNIIVILADDQGYADLSCFGRVKDVKTPNLDALAENGVNCTAGYVTSPQCAPSRAGLMTGRYNERIDFDTIPDGPLSLKEVTLAERLQKEGYVTGHVGKWHLEPNHTCIRWARKACPGRIKMRGNQEIVKLPWELIAKYQSGNQGFDDFYSGELHHYWRNYDLDGRDLKPSGESITYPEDRYRIDIQTDAALAFLDRHADGNKPFFLYLCYYAPHMPLAATQKYLDRFPGDMPERRRYALAMISSIDDGVGRIQEKLKKYGQSDNTLVFYLADNGAPLGAQQGPGGHMDDILPVGDYRGAWDGSRNDPLTGEKGMLMEGGIRVPYLVSWPDRLPKGAMYNEPVSSLDIAATCMAAAGRPVSAELDGVDLIPRLTGKTEGPRTLFWRFWNQAAVRDGNWKYFTLSDGQEYLVDISSDIKEKNNLLSEYPEKAQELRAELVRWTHDMKPEGLPSQPPNGQEEGWYQYYLNTKPAATVSSVSEPSGVLLEPYAAMDTNSDGALSLDEFVEGRTVLEKPLLMKKNNLTEEQYQAQREGYRGNYRANFKKRDVNKDGVLNADELR